MEIMKNERVLGVFNASFSDMHAITLFGHVLRNVHGRV